MYGEALWDFVVFFMFHAVNKRREYTVFMLIPFHSLYNMYTAIFKEGRHFESSNFKLFPFIFLHRLAVPRLLENIFDNSCPNVTLFNV